MNRHERRKRAAQERRGERIDDTASDAISFAVDLDTPEARETLRARTVENAEWRALTERMVELLLEWGRANPLAKLEWHPQDHVLIMSALGEPAAQRLLAKNAAALDLLGWLDEQTDGRGDMMQAFFALEYVGAFRERDPEKAAAVDRGIELVRSYGRGDGTITRVGESHCPHCGKPTSAHRSGEGATPHPGALAICVYCGGVSVIEEGLALRAITDAEWEELHPEQRIEVQAASAVFREANERAQNGGPDGS